MKTFAAILLLIAFAIQLFSINTVRCLVEKEKTSKCIMIVGDIVDDGDLLDIHWIKYLKEQDIDKFNSPYPFSTLEYTQIVARKIGLREENDYVFHYF